MENLLLPAAGGNTFTGDLGAINIQRARDHGIPGYVEISRACGGQPPSGTNFEGLSDIIPGLRLVLETCYRTVEDIDLFPGILLESIQTGSEMGPTATCLFLAQFNDSRRGDRFWYERDDPCTGFIMEQLTEIRKVTLARVICDNSDGVFDIQPNVFLRRNNNNNNDVPCSQIPGIDFNVFRESKYFLLFAICILDILLRWKRIFFFFQYFENVSTHCSRSKYSITLVLNFNVEKFSPSSEIWAFTILNVMCSVC